MKDKYYTPSIEEFHVGFEFEFEKHFHTKEGQQSEWEPMVFRTSFVGLERISLERLRVKCLDREDIESLGFKLTGGKLIEGKRDIYELPYKNGREDGIDILTLIHPAGRENWCLIVEGSSINPVRDHHTRFAGSIRNKSELKKVLKMIGVE